MNATLLKRGIRRQLTPIRVTLVSAVVLVPLAFAQLGGAVLVGNRHEFGAEAANLIGQFFDVAPRPECNHLEARGRGRSDSQDRPSSPSCLPSASARPG